ncbi:acyltransferase domain-containing protein [Streptomyces sp. NBC_00647]|uniref:type I polyketide synthase n=1 Tax=Streptomyces sp. NBC_00647 TaxID=2975796 RepID=UPI003255BA39
MSDATFMGSDADTAVAVIGLAGRFPGSDSVDQMWSNLLAGEESLTRFSTEQLIAAGVPADEYKDPDYVPVRGILSDVDLFDAAFFGYSAREAQLTDPQQRLLLECAWHALDAAGYGGFEGRGGVFAGTGMNSYLLHHLLADPHGPKDTDLLQLMLGNEKDHAATRIAYKLGLRGPAVAVQTACSTSLVAVHLARQSLLMGECDIALAGGASVQFPQHSGYVYSRNGILSPDGHCRPFDRDARGTVVGHGAALVVLKRARDAYADGDTVHALIRGSAINNDGGRKAGYTAPSAEGQAEVIGAALRSAGVAADTIGYVEAHGTGTEIGDGIEISGLTEAYRHYTDKTGFCTIGSLKANLGHLDAAAGVTGLIKAVLAVREGTIPPAVNCPEPNPEIDWSSTPFFVNTGTRTWLAEGGPRRAGVSAFGIGGTNAHVIVEQAPAQPVPPAQRSRPSLMVLSARDPQAARASADLLAQSLDTAVAADVPDIAYTLQVGRVTNNWRTAVVGGDPHALRDQLRSALPRRAYRAGTLGFMFPGQGAQRLGMASGLYDELPRFRAVVDECSEHLAGQLGIDLRTLLLDTTGDTGLETTLRRTRLAQPALFVTEYALASQLLDWGMRPRVLIGHSLGEYTAACVAQALSLPDALDLVAVRGRLMDGAPPGAMLAVHAAGDKVEPLLPEGVSIAACNAPEAVVVSGPCEAVEQFAETAAKRGIFVRPLRVSHGFHSVLMDSVLDEFRDHASAVRYRRPRLRVMSNLTGEPVRAYSAEYWTRHLREPVGFSAGLARVLDMADPMLAEVGPGRTLTSFARSHERDAALPCQPMMPGTEGTDPYTALLAAVGALWTAGTEVDWTAFSGGQGRRIVLPPYPFQRRRHWVERSAPARAEPLPAPKEATELVAQQQEPMREGPEPATVESRLQAIWKQLLGDQPISDDADFFGLGGDSLLAVRLLSLIRREFAVTLNLDTVLEHPVLAAQVALVRERSTESFTPADGHAGEDTIAP